MCGITQLCSLLAFFCVVRKILTWDGRMVLRMILHLYAQNVKIPFILERGF